MAPTPKPPTCPIACSTTPTVRPRRSGARPPRLHKAARRYGIAALLLAIAVALAPPTMAGTEADPEIEDTTGDATIPTSPTVQSRDALDLAAVWIQEDDDELAFNWKVVALTAPGPAERFEYNVDFKVNGTEFTTQVWRQRADALVGGGIWGSEPTPCAHTSSDRSLPATLQWSEETGIVTFTAPRSFLTGCPAAEDRALDGAESLTDLHATTFHCVMARMNTCESESTPDEAGPGRDFLFAALSTVPENDGLPPGEQVETPGPGGALVLMALVTACALALRRHGETAA